MPRKSKSLTIPIGDKLDKFRAHLIESEPLTDTERQTLERYRKAWSWLCMMYSRNRVVALIEKEYQLSTSQAYVVVRESLELFGDVIENDRKAQRSIMYENFMLAARLARKNGDHNAMIRAIENAARIKAVFSDEAQTIDPNLFLIPVPVLFNSDPQVLTQNVIDISHDDQPES